MGRDDSTEVSTEEGQVSEVANLDEDTLETEGYPTEATAGYPDTESGKPDEGTAGPNARPRDDRPGRGPDNDS
jgi:hypothetical protein